MNTYQILRRTVFGMIVAALLWSGAITASAEESYTVKIPKNIKLDSNGEYADTLITVNGTLASDQVLSITTNDTLTLSSQGKKDLSRKVKLSASIINSTDVSNGVTINCKITRKSIFFIKKDTPTAGTWNGNMEVSIQSAYTPSDFEWEIVNNRIRLKKYTGSNPNVVVHGNYYVKGKVYQTEVYQTFKNNSTVESIKFEKGIYCQYATDLFFNCSNLTTLDLSNFDTSKVTNMNSMFDGCENLTTLDVSNFDTSNVTDMYSMFDGDSGTVYVATADIKATMESKFTNMTFVVKNNKMSSASVLSAPTLTSVSITTVSDGNADVAMDGPIINEEETIKDSVSSGDAETSTSDDIISDDTEDTLSDDDWMQLALSVSDGNAAPGDREKCEEKLTEMQESGITPEISELMKILMQIIISVILPRYRWY